MSHLFHWQSLQGLAQCWNKAKQNESLVKCRLVHAIRCWQKKEPQQPQFKKYTSYIHLIYTYILFVTSTVLVTNCISSCCRSGWLHLSHVLSCLASIFCLSPTLWLPATHTCLKSVVSSKLPSRAAVMAGLSFDEQFNRYTVYTVNPSLTKQTSSFTSQ